jgi:hypothetical protein
MSNIDSPIIAINILLEPDDVMVQRAEANNARLREVFPMGFALDATHRPHITLFQCFVRTADLDAIYAAADKVFAANTVLGLQLEAFRYYYVAGGPVGLPGIVVKPTPELRKLQHELIEAIGPQTVATGDSDAFFTTADDPVIDPMLIAYVSTFASKMSGEHFEAHVTTGIGPIDFLDAMLAEPFEAFTFSPAAGAVYQLGQFGTAAKKLHDCGVER